MANAKTSKVEYFIPAGTPMLLFVAPTHGDITHFKSTKDVVFDSHDIFMRWGTAMEFNLPANDREIDTIMVRNQYIQRREK